MTIDPVLGGILIAIVSGAGTYLASRYAARTSMKTKKVDVEAEAYLRADQLTAGVVERLRLQVEDLDKGRKEDQKRITEVAEEVRKVRDYNNQLITFIYKMIALIRRHELTGEIDPKDVPDGIHI